MNRALLKKSLREARLLLAGCALWLFIFCWVRVWIVSRMERTRFESILEQFGDLVETVSPVAISHLVSFTGRIAIGFDEAMVVFVVLAFAIARGSDVVSGELGRGTMEMLLAQPVSRWQVLTSQAVVTVVGLALLSLTVWIGTWTGIQTTKALIEKPLAIKIAPGLSIPLPLAKPKVEAVPMRTQVNPQVMIPGAVNLFFLGLCFAGITSCLSSFDRYRWRSIGLVLGFLVIEMVTKVIGVLVPNWSWLKFLSVLSAYEPQKLIEIATHQPQYTWWLLLPGESGRWLAGPLVYHGVLAGIGLAGYAVSAMAFDRRDLPAPL